jgi:hypothetical protein
MRRLVRGIPFLAFALSFPTAAAAQSALPVDRGLPREHAPEPTTAAITPADLMTRLYVFSDDSMLGRRTGELGDVRGTSYIAREIEKMGLVPAGDDGTYFQTIPLKTRTLEESSSLSTDGKALVLGDDWAPLSRTPANLGPLQVVYGGDFGDSAHAIADSAAAGKLVVYTATGRGSLRALFRGGPPPGRAAVVAVAALDRFSPRLRSFLTRPGTFVDDGTTDGGSAAPIVLLGDSAAGRLLGAAPEALRPGAAGRTASLRVAYDIRPVADPARNVVGIVPGSDPELKGEYVAIGAHNDHLGVGRPVDHDSIMIFNHVVRPEGADDGRKQATPAQEEEVDSLLAVYRKTHADRMDSTYNGADDDGSGTVSALEIAQKLEAMDPHPKRSILFVWHVGEEEGLYGSRYFTDHPTVPRDSIVAQLNMDMVGRGDATDETGRTKDGQPLHGGPNYVQLVGSRRLSTELGDLIEKVNTEDGHDLTFDYAMDANGHPSNIYCRSDHYSYARYGIPITFFTTGLHSDYHQVTDEPEYIDYPHMAKVANLVADVAVHVADLDHRPVVDHPVPDPNAPCQQ